MLRSVVIPVLRNVGSQRVRLRKRVRRWRKHNPNFGWYLALELLTSEDDARGRLLRHGHEEGLARARAKLPGRR